MSQHPGQNPFAATSDAPDAEVRSYATFTHLVPLIAHLGGPFIIPLVAAIIMWQIKKDESPFLDDHGRESTNFQLSMLIYAILVVPIAAIITCGLGAILAIPLLVLNIVGCILAAKAAHRGEYYRYPMSIRIV
ncbi:MAG: DUF4870 domain-containing protein [Phycisphaeraceae bacterium]|nr:DUF4870 domain-containing protein [Phycisphaeraceae bacterium]